MHARWLLPAGLALALAAGGLGACSATSDDVAGDRAAPTVLASAVVAELEDAVRSGDVAAARSLAPTGDSATADRLAGLVANARAARVDEFALAVEDVVPTDGIPAQEWRVPVEATWRFAGLDPAASRADVVVSLRRDGDRLAVTGIGDGDDVTPLWLAGPIRVARGPHSLVLVDGTAREARAYARHASAAVPAVRRVLPDWHGGLVVEVPASGDALARVLGAEPGTYDRIAALTAPAGSRTEDDAPVHVLVNPDVLGRLTPTGARVVLTHEATHVATDAYRSTMPLWLVEGFADVVALRDSGQPVRQAVARATAQVGRVGAPARLPSDADLAPGSPRLGATYQSAWLACRVLAREAGVAGVVRLYRDVDAGRPLAAALRADVGLTLADLTVRWRTLLERWAVLEDSAR